MSEYISFIMTYIFRVMTVLLSFVLYVFLTAHVYPKLFLKPYLNEGKGDRGLKKYRYRNGRAIVYEPSFKMRKYVKQYILSLNDGRKYIKCKLDERIKSIVYDVIAYDADGSVIDDILVSDCIERKGYSSAAELPGETSYVNIIVREVNGYKVDHEKVAIYSAAEVCAFFAISIITTVLEYVLVRLELTNAAKLMSIDVGENGAMVTVLIALLLGVFSSVLIFFSKYSSAVKIAKKPSKNKSTDRKET